MKRKEKKRKEKESQLWLDIVIIPRFLSRKYSLHQILLYPILSLPLLSYILCNPIWLYIYFSLFISKWNHIMLITQLLMPFSTIQRNIPSDGQNGTNVCIKKVERSSRAAIRKFTLYEITSMAKKREAAQMNHRAGLKSLDVETCLYIYICLF